LKVLPVVTNRVTTKGWDEFDAALELLVVADAVTVTVWACELLNEPSIPYPTAIPPAAISNMKAIAATIPDVLIPTSVGEVGPYDISLEAVISYSCGIKTSYRETISQDRAICTDIPEALD